MIDLKIGRNTYQITPSDKFMDNGACVQLLTQSKEVPVWGQRTRPVLSKRAIKEIDKFKRIEKQRDGQMAYTFSLAVGDEI